MGSLKSTKAVRGPGSLSPPEAELSRHFAHVVRLQVVEGHLRVTARGALGFVGTTPLGHLRSFLLTSHHLESPRPLRALTGPTKNHKPGPSCLRLHSEASRVARMGETDAEGERLSASPSSYSLDLSFLVREMGGWNKMLSQVCPFLPMLCI